MRRALIPGSFDPPTLGHREIIRRAAASFDEVTVGLFVNPDKTYLFTPEERAELLRLACNDLPNVRIEICDGYTADYAKSGGFSAIVRGYRNPEDLTYENAMANFNLSRGGVNTLLLRTSPALAEVSSTDARRRLSEGEDLSAVMPAECIGVAHMFYKLKTHA